jgi:hypothetical protein
MGYFGKVIREKLWCCVLDRCDLLPRKYGPLDGKKMKKIYNLLVHLRKKKKTVDQPLDRH